MEIDVPIEMLWKKYAEGNKEVFGDIYLHYYPDLYAYGKSISLHTELIDEAIQELFMRIWSNPPMNAKSIDNYIFISFRNELFKHLKNKKRHLKKQLGDRHVDHSLQRSAEDEVIKKEMDHEKRNQIQKALESLPARRREAIFLKFYQNKSTREISTIMNIREEMVRNYIYKGIKALRAHYSDQLFLIITVQTFLISLMMG